MGKLIKNINQDTFKPYGIVIEQNLENPKKFQVIINETGKVGWRIAVSRLAQNMVQGMGKHPDSMESFEPVSGVVILLVALPETPEDFEVFLLDRPVCLFKNIWHATLTLSECALVKITENLEVNSENYRFKKEYRGSLS